MTGTTTSSASVVTALGASAPVTAAGRMARGRAARTDVPRSAHGGFAPPADRFDPVAVLRAQDAERVPELVPIRYGRMAISPFTFFRGAAAVMAADLAGTPVSGPVVQICGDATCRTSGSSPHPSDAWCST